ncbi:MAG: efflux RND transporter periplasmic adaptor subunit [Pseudomonadota bacterium]
MRFAPLLLVLVIATGLALWFGLLERGTAVDAAVDTAVDTAAEAAPEARALDTPVPVSVLAVAPERIADQLLVRGRTHAWRRVEVEAETTGAVISEPLRRGTRVAAGDVLCRLDPGSRPARLAEAEAALVEARAEARAAESLSSKGFAAETTRFARLARLQAAEAEVELIRLDIKRLEIRAPFAGLLQTDTAELGARLSEGESCATVIDLSRVRVSGYVAEDAVDRLALGRTARIRLVNGQSAEGQVSFVAASADPATRTYEVEVEVANPETRMRDGMTAEFAVTLAEATAHLIPQSALTLDDTGRLGVRLAEESRARFVPVRVLRDQSDGVWVTGLNGTAQIIVVGQEFVRDGRPLDARSLTRAELQ